MAPGRATRTSFAFLFLLFVSASGHAAAIYRWVDANGRIHLSDTVPEKYRAQATAIDSRQFDVSPDEAAQARAQVDHLKAHAAGADAPVHVLPLVPPTPRAAAPRTALTEVEFGKLDFAARWTRYRESLESFAPFIERAPWSAPPEAFQKCTVLKDPSARCPINYAPGLLNNSSQ